MVSSFFVLASSLKYFAVFFRTKQTTWSWVLQKGAGEWPETLGLRRAGEDLAQADDAEGLVGVAQVGDGRRQPAGTIDCVSVERCQAW